MTEKLFCHHCGKPLAQSAKFCSYCGKAIIETNDIDDDSLSKEEESILSVEEKQPTNELVDSDTKKYYLPIVYDKDDCIRKIILDIVTNDSVPIEVLDSVRDYEEYGCLVTFCKYDVWGSANWNATFERVRHFEVPRYDGQGNRVGTKTETEYYPYPTSGNCSFNTTIYLPAVKMEEAPELLRNILKNNISKLFFYFDNQNLKPIEEHFDTNAINSLNILPTIPIHQVWSENEKTAKDKLEIAVEMRVKWNMKCRASGDDIGGYDFNYSYNTGAATPILIPYKGIVFKYDNKQYNYIFDLSSGKPVDKTALPQDTKKEVKEEEISSNRGLLLCYIFLTVILGFIAILLFCNESFIGGIIFTCSALITLFLSIRSGIKASAIKNQLTDFLSKRRQEKLKRAKQLFGIIWNQELENMLIAEQSKIASEK